MIGRLSREMLRRGSRISVAVAWATSHNDVAQVLMLRKVQPKIARLVFGTTNGLTEPALLEHFIGHPGARAIWGNVPMMHAKVFLFESKRHWSALVGSSNLTGGGFERNIEAGVFVSGGARGADAEVLGSIKKFIDDVYQMGDPITAKRLGEYAVTRKKTMKSMPRKAARRRTGKASTELESFDWTAYVNAIKKSDGAEERLDLLETAQRWLRKTDGFASLNNKKRQLLAGLVIRNPRHEETAEGEYEEHWAAFGRMTAARAFWTAVNEHGDQVGKALAAIPSRGEVSERNYLDFIARLKRAFAGKVTFKIAVASRLLMMKRPDVFFCLNSKNQHSFRQAYGARRITIENYWRQVVERIQGSPWNRDMLMSPPKRGLAGRLWRNRAAMLDSIYANWD